MFYNSPLGWSSKGSRINNQAQYLQGGIQSNQPNPYAQQQLLLRSLGDQNQSQNSNDIKRPDDLHINLHNVTSSEMSESEKKNDESVSQLEVTKLLQEISQNCHQLNSEQGKKQHSSTSEAEFPEPIIKENNKETNSLPMNSGIKRKYEEVFNDCETKIEMDCDNTLKASVEEIANQSELKKPIKKNKRSSGHLRRERLNLRLSKILTPKSALILLNELKPGCLYTVKEHLELTPPQFSTDVVYDGKVLGTGQGLSKSHSKNLAAEDAIKTIVSEAMLQAKSNNDANVEKNAAENLPWTGLASFALFKLFNDWQSRGADFPMTIVSSNKLKQKVVSKTAPAKILPQNATDFHPTTLLNLMKPGLLAVELERQMFPKSVVTMGYLIDDQMHSGKGSNKKEAKREAAKTALMNLYGVKYS